MSAVPHPTPEEGRVTHFRGTLFQGVRKQADTEGGPQAWADMMATLSPGTQKVFAVDPGRFEWVEVSFVNELMLAHQARYGLGAVKARLTDTAETELTQDHPWLLKLLSPQTLMHQTGTLWRFFFKGGVVETRSVGRDRSELVVWATGLYPSFYTHSLVHWLVRAMELCGARNCTVVHTPATRDEDPHRYAFHW